MNGILTGGSGTLGVDSTLLSTRLIDDVPRWRRRPELRTLRWNRTSHAVPPTLTRFTFEEIEELANSNPVVWAVVRWPRQ